MAIRSNNRSNSFQYGIKDALSLPYFTLATKQSRSTIKRTRIIRTTISLVISVLPIVSIFHNCYIQTELGSSYPSIEESIESTLHGTIEESIRPTTHSSFCLLIKDQNDLLPEWIAYHYHVFNMRRLIIAVDPTSSESPSKVLEPWKGKNFQLNYTIWNDKDYTPEFFGVDKNYAQLQRMKNFVYGVEFDKDTGDIINAPHAFVSNEQLRNHSLQPQIRRDIQLINNHRYRQRKFVSECYRQLKSENQERTTWVVHIDTDEYLVPNPWIHSYGKESFPEVGDGRRDQFIRQSLIPLLPSEPSKGSLWTFYEQWMNNLTQYDKHQKRVCTLMPRPLFGTKEDDDDPSNHTISSMIDTTSGNQHEVLWNHSKFETLRWKYHADFLQATRPKSIVDVTQVSLQSHIFQPPFGIIDSVHAPIKERTEMIQMPLPERNKVKDKAGPRQEKRRPRYKKKIISHGCKSISDFLSIGQNKIDQPIAVYHYIGSRERFLSRDDCLKRKKSTFKSLNKGADFSIGDMNSNLKEGTNSQLSYTWWIKGWLNHFVIAYGTTNVLTVLGDDYTSISQSASRFSLLTYVKTILATPLYFLLPNRVDW